jgi:hypothetical protein
MRLALKRISMVHVLVLACFEFAALFFISLFGVDTATFSPLKNALGGLAVGFFGTIPVLVALNFLLDRNEIRFGGIRLWKISVMPSSIYNGFFLCLLFFIESFTYWLKSWHVAIGNALVGATTTPLSLLATILLYNALSYKIRFSGRPVVKVGIKGLVISAAIYEAIALPIMALLGKGYLSNPHIAFAITGLVSGLVGGIVAMMAYNAFLQSTIFIETQAQ